MPANTQRKVLTSIWQQKIFVEAYPIKNKSDYHLVLDKFVKEYGALDKMT